MCKPICCLYTSPGLYTYQIQVCNTIKTFPLKLQATSDARKTCSRIFKDTVTRLKRHHKS